MQKIKNPASPAGFDPDGNYPNMTVGAATKATQDGQGRDIASTYALKGEGAKLYKHTITAGVYDKWAAGKYEVGDIRTHAGQVWECWTAHDNAIYPDITPDNPQTWANFWRPLHGKSPETARP